MRKVLLVILILVILLPLVILVARSKTPVIDVPSPVATLGQATPISVHVRNARGIRSVKAAVEQSGVHYPVWQVELTPRVTDGTWSFTAGVKSTTQLKDGKAKLIIEATSNDFLRKKGRWEREVTVVTQPPSVSVDRTSIICIWAWRIWLLSASLEAGPRRACALAIRPFGHGRCLAASQDTFRFFAFAWNMPPNTVPVVYAANGAGNDVTSPIVFQFPKKEQPHYTVHDLQVSDAFMQKVVNELDPNGSGDYVTALCAHQ